MADMAEADADDCCDLAQVKDCCAMDTRVERAAGRAETPLLTKLAPAVAPVPAVLDLAAVLRHSSVAGSFDRPVPKLPQAPIYLLVSVFLV